MIRLFLRFRYLLLGSILWLTIFSIFYTFNPITPDDNRDDNSSIYHRFAAVQQFKVSHFFFVFSLFYLENFDLSI